MTENERKYKKLKKPILRTQFRGTSASPVTESSVRFAKQNANRSYNFRYGHKLP